MSDLLLSDAVTSKTKSLVDSFLKRHGISFFGFDRIFDDGSCIRLSTNPEVLTFLHEAKAVVTVPIPGNLVADKITYLVPLGDHKRVDKFYEFKRRFEVGHLIDFIERKHSYYEQFWFFSKQENDWAANFYLNQSDVCEALFKQFKDEGSSLLQSIQNSRILLDPLMLQKIRWKEPHKNTRVVKLSPQEQACVTRIALGDTIPQIATQLNLSARTVGHYVDNIKNKLGCERKSEILLRAIELNLINSKLNFK